MNKKLISALLIVAAFFSASCGSNGRTGEKGGGKLPVKIWAADDTEKILRDADYKDRMTDECEIRISGAKNECENAQFIMTADKDVSEYQVKILSDLKGEKGVFSRGNFSVYNEKYIEVKKTTTNNFRGGWYPDALLPIESAVKYGENAIKEGENQGIWIECNIPKDQKAGTYAGEIEVTAEGRKKNLPIKVKVFDYTLSDKVHSRTSFGIHRYWNEGGIVSAEKDAGYDMYSAYYEYLLKHRISARYMPSAMADIKGFAAQLKKYARDERCSNYIMPYVEKYDTSFDGTGIDYDLYKRQMDEIAGISVEDNFNYFEKASTYFAMYDEITSAKDIRRANAFYGKICKVHFDMAKKWENSLDCDSRFKKEIIESMLNMVQLMVTSYNPSFTSAVTFCPLLSKYNLKASKDLYMDTYTVRDEESGYEIRQNEEKWWYSAGIPKNPYATYHIDDNGFSPIIYSWMQYANKVKGNLYWSSTFYLEYTKENNRVVYNALQDCYSLAMRFPNTNGDGFLLYPGAPYGIYGPVGSVRFQQIADGLEEYDMLSDLEKRYNELKERGISPDFESIAGLLYDGLFYGTKINATSSGYESRREMLLSMLELYENEGILFTDAKYANEYATVSVYVPDGKDVSFGGEVIEKTSCNGGNIYRLKHVLARNESLLKVTCGGYSARIMLGGKTTEYKEEALKGLVFAKNGQLKEGGQGVEITFLKDGKLHSVSFTDKLYGLIDGNIGKMEIHLESDCCCDYTLYFTGHNGLAVPVLTGKTEKGDNVLEVNTDTLNWKTIGGLTAVDMEIGQTDDPQIRLVIKSIVLR